MSRCKNDKLNHHLSGVTLDIRLLMIGNLFKYSGCKIKDSSQNIFVLNFVTKINLAVSKMQEFILISDASFDVPRSLFLL